MRTDPGSPTEASDCLDLGPRLALSTPQAVSGGLPDPGMATRVSRTPAPPRARRTPGLDPEARAAAERMALTLAQGLAALLAVGAVLGLIHHPATRAWALLLPLALLMMPIRTRPGLGGGRLTAALQGLGLVLRAVIAVLGLQLALWVLDSPPLAADTLLLLFTCVAALGLGAQWLVRRIARRWQRPQRVVIAGAGPQGRAIHAHLMAQGEALEIVGFLDDRRTRLDLAGLPAPLLGPISGFRAADWGVDGIVLALPQDASQRIGKLASSFRTGLLNVYLAPEAPVLAHPMLSRQPGELESMVLLGMERLPLGGRLGKRAFDIAFSAAVLLAFLPIGLVIAALIKLESPGPVIFRQPRCGLGGRLFNVYKFRSMRHAPPPAPGQIRLTERGDSRVTKIGDFLRRSSLDEFPQFLNVLLGDMSVVGPRPHPPGVKAGERTYEEVVADFMERYKARPGITGWAQVNGSRGNTFTEAHITERFDYDIDYLRHWSFELDLLIVIRTAFGGFGGKNAF